MFLAPHFTFNKILIFIKAISGLRYSCDRVFGHQVNLEKLDSSTPNHVEEHV